MRHFSSPYHKCLARRSALSSEKIFLKSSFVALNQLAAIEADDTGKELQGKGRRPMTGGRSRPAQMHGVRQ